MPVSALPTINSVMPGWTLRPAAGAGAGDSPMPPSATYSANFDFGGGVEEVNILLPSDTDTTDYYRPPMIRATLSTALGFLGLSWLYPESIFYRYENLRTSFAPIDRTAIELMYLPELHVGMTRSQIIRALTNR